MQLRRYTQYLALGKEVDSTNMSIICRCCLVAESYKSRASQSGRIKVVACAFEMSQGVVTVALSRLESCQFLTGTDSLSYWYLLFLPSCIPLHLIN